MLIGTNFLKKIEEEETEYFSNLFAHEHLSDFRLHRLQTHMDTIHVRIGFLLNVFFASYPQGETMLVERRKVMMKSQSPWGSLVSLHRFLIINFCAAFLCSVMWCKEPHMSCAGFYHTLTGVHFSHVWAELRVGEYNHSLKTSGLVILSCTICLTDSRNCCNSLCLSLSLS